MLHIIEIPRLVRIVNCLMTSAAVWVGAYLTAGPQMTFEIAAAMAAAALMCAAGNVVNDLFDIKADAIAHPNRPLVTGRVSINVARSVAVIVHLLALAAASLANLGVLGLAVLSLALLYLYNARLKRLPLVGNLTVAVLAGLVFVWGGLAVEGEAAFHLPGPLVPALFAFFFHLIREIIKDTEDMAGDSSAGVRTLPHVVGERAALGLALTLFVCLAVLTLVPVWQGWYGVAYEFVVVALIDIPLLGLLLWTVRVPSGEHIRWSRAGLKAGMAVGLLALLVA